MHWKLLLLVFSHMGPRNRPSEPSLWAHQSRPRVEFSKARMASIGAQKKSLLLKPWMRNTMKTCFLPSRQFLTLLAYPTPSWRHQIWKHFGFFEIFFWTSPTALAECQSARRTYVSVSTFFLGAVAQKLTELDLAPRRAAVTRCSGVWWYRWWS